MQNPRRYRSEGGWFYRFRWPASNGIGGRFHRNTHYIIRCNDGTLYTGVTTELERRFQEHLNHPRGAKYFNGRKPLEVVYSENGYTRSSACQREAAIKKLSREEKLRLIADAD